MGAVEDIWIAPDAHRIIDSPTATPISAVSIVIPAATTEPKVMSRTTRATTTPMPSVDPMEGDCFTAPPPNSIRSPSTACDFARSAIAVWVATGISVI